MHVGSGKPYYCKGTQISPKGKQVCHEFKAIEFDDGFVVWELRRLVEGIGFDFATNVKYYRSHKAPLLTELLQSMECVLDGPYILLGKRSADAKGFVKNAVVATYILDEFTVQSNYFVATLLFAPRLSFHNDKLDMAMALRRLFFTHGLPCNFEEGVRSFRHPKIYQDVLCGGAAGQPCAHSFLLTKAIADSDAASLSPQEKFLFVFDEISRHDCSCAQVGRWFKDVCDELCVVLHDNLANFGHTNALKSWRPETFKRRRMDEHMKNDAIDQVRRQGLAPNVTTWARATQQANPKSMAYVRDGNLAAYHAATLQCMAGSDTYKIIMDGSRLGEPKLEYEFSVGENCDTHVAAWGPPLVARPLSRQPDWW
jgi:hypothetical protein